MRNSLYLLLILFHVVYGRTLMNGFGIGQENLFSNGSELGMGSFGLTPSFRQDVSLSNPSTWNNLNIAYIASGYNAGEFISGPENMVSGHSALSMVKLVVPFKGKLALGVEFKPYSSQLVDAYESGIFMDGDEYTFRTISGGGINSVNIGMGVPVTSDESFGVQINYVYGSNRKVHELTQDDRTFVLFDKNSYTGTLFNLYGNSSRFTFGGKPVDIYFNTKFSLKPVVMNGSSMAPFEDKNSNGFYDQQYPVFDYPGPSLLGGTVINDEVLVHDPFQFGFGIAYSIKPFLLLTSELSISGEKSSNTHLASVLNDYPERETGFSVALMGHGKKNGRDFRDKVFLRTGLYFNTSEMKFSQDKIIEKGLNLGLGIKFGIFNNQIDVGYSYGTRSSLEDIPGEIIQNFNLTLSLGDLWFVKRRAR